jgi:hypothetical protein
LELSDVAQLYDEVAKELELAAQHCRVASTHFGNKEVPRGSAHAWAAYGHLMEAQERMHEQARDHAKHAIPQA